MEGNILKLEATEHSYYCSDTNYYVGNKYGENFGLSEYETWEEFSEAWDSENIDYDYSLLFRYDIKNKYDEKEDEEIEGEYYLELFFILQRKGIFKPVVILDLKEDDLSEVEKMLKDAKQHLFGLWEEVEVVS